MESPRKPRLDPRMVFAAVLIAIPVLYVVAQIIVVRATDDCGDPDHTQVGGIAQMFVPGDACPQTPRGR
jgi:hypothetical protein